MHKQSLLLVVWRQRIPGLRQWSARRHQVPGAQPRLRRPLQHGTSEPLLAGVIDMTVADPFFEDVQAVVTQVEAPSPPQPADGGSSSPAPAPTCGKSMHQPLPGVSPRGPAQTHAPRGRHNSTLPPPQRRTGTACGSAGRTAGRAGPVGRTDAVTPPERCGVPVVRLHGSQPARDLQPTAPTAHSCLRRSIPRHTTRACGTVDAPLTRTELTVEPWARPCLLPSLTTLVIRVRAAGCPAASCFNPQTSRGFVEPFNAALWRPQPP